MKNFQNPTKRVELVTGKAKKKKPVQNAWKIAFNFTNQLVFIATTNQYVNYIYWKILSDLFYQNWRILHAV